MWWSWSFSCWLEFWSQLGPTVRNGGTRGRSVGRRGGIHRLAGLALRVGVCRGGHGLRRHRRYSAWSPNKVSYEDDSPTSRWYQASPLKTCKKNYTLRKTDYMWSDFKAFIWILSTFDNVWLFMQLHTIIYFCSFMIWSFTLVIMHIWVYIILFRSVSFRKNPTSLKTLA